MSDSPDKRYNKFPDSPAQQFDPISPVSAGEILPSNSGNSPRQFEPCSPPFLQPQPSNAEIDPSTGEKQYSTATRQLLLEPDILSISNPPSPVTPPTLSPMPNGTNSTATGDARQVPSRMNLPLSTELNLDSSDSETNRTEASEPYFSDRITTEDKMDFDKYSNPRIRLDALHMQGTDELCTKDLELYFLAFGKVSVEWVNDSSCNIRFKDKHTATQALFSVGYKPFQPCSTPDSQERGDSGVSSSDEISGFLIDLSNPWRLALPHFKNRHLMLRYATTADRKQPWAATRSQFYLKYGNPHRGELRPDHLLSSEGRDRKRRVKKRLGSQVNVLNIEVDENLDGYIADIEASEQAPSKFMKLYSDFERPQQNGTSDDSDDNFIFVEKSSVDLRTKLNAKKT